MLLEPNFPVRPKEFIGRRRQIETFCQALQQGLQAGRTASFAILGDWGIGKSSLLLKFAALSSQPSFTMLPVFISASSDVGDYLGLAENLLDRFTDVLLAVPTMQTLLRVELRNWRLKSVNLGGVGLERESPRLFLSSGSSLLRHKLKDKLKPIWPTIFDQLGREKFRSDVSQLSAREFEFVRRFASLSENELATQHYTGKFRRECFGRLVEKGLLIRAGRGRCKLLPPAFP